MNFTANYLYQLLTVLPFLSNAVVNKKADNMQQFLHFHVIVDLAGFKHPHSYCYYYYHIIIVTIAVNSVVFQQSRDN